MMFVGKVIGTVTCTEKDDSLHGMKLLVVQPVDDDLNPQGNAMVAIDTIGQSGQGDIVYLARSKESSIPLDKEMVASDAGIVGIIDQYFIQ